MNHRSEIDAINRSFSNGPVAGNCAPRYAGDMQMGKAVQEEWRTSRPEEFHLQALPKPCVNLSIHTAPDVRPLADEPPALPRPRAPPVASWLQLAGGLG